MILDQLASSETNQSRSTAFSKERIQCSPFLIYSETCLKQPLSKRPKIGFKDQLTLNAGQKYCIMLQSEHSATLSTFVCLI